MFRLLLLESATGLKTSLDTAMAGQYELKNQLDQLQRTVRSRDKQIESLSTAKQEVATSDSLNPFRLIENEKKISAKDMVRIMYSSVKFFLSLKHIQ